MGFQVTGTITVLNASEQITDTFAKRLLVLSEQDGQYENLYAVEWFNDKGTLLDAFGIGQQVTVDFNLKSREHKGRYFTSITGWRIKEVEGSAKIANPAVANEPQAEGANGAEKVSDDLPF